MHHRATLAGKSYWAAFHATLARSRCISLGRDSNSRFYQAEDFT